MSLLQRFTNLQAALFLLLAQSWHNLNSPAPEGMSGFRAFAFRVRSGQVIIGAIIALGVVVIVIPLVYLISAAVGNSLPTSLLTSTQSATMVSLVNVGGSALQLTAVAEVVMGAGIIILGIYLFFRFK